MLSSFLENIFRAELVAAHLQEALPIMLTALTEAAAQMPKNGYLRNERRKCLEVMRAGADSLRRRSSAAAAAAQSADKLSRAGSDFAGRASKEIKHEQLNLMRTCPRSTRRPLCQHSRGLNESSGSQTKKREPLRSCKILQRYCKGIHQYRCA